MTEWTQATQVPNIQTKTVVLQSLQSLTSQTHTQKHRVKRIKCAANRDTLECDNQLKSRDLLKVLKHNLHGGCLVRMFHPH